LAAWFCWLTHENPAAARGVARTLGGIRTVDRHLIDGRRHPWMPVHVEMSLIRLSLRLQQHGRSFEKRHSELMRACRHWEAQLQSLVHAFIVLVWGWHYGKQLQSLTVQQQLQLMWRAQALNFFVAIARQPDLDLILAIAWKGVGNQGTAASANRQPFNVLFLSQVRPNAEGVPSGRTTQCSDCRAADFLRCRG